MDGEKKLLGTQNRKDLSCILIFYFTVLFNWKRFSMLNNIEFQMLYTKIVVFPLASWHFFNVFLYILSTHFWHVVCELAWLSGCFDPKYSAWWKIHQISWAVHWQLTEVERKNDITFKNSPDFLGLVCINSMCIHI